MEIPLAVSSPLRRRWFTDVYYRAYEVVIEEHHLPTNLILLEMVDLDVILCMDWLSTHYATLNCRQKAVTFYIPGVPSFYFQGEKWSASNCLISFLKDGRLMKKGCHAFLAYVKEGKDEGPNLEDVRVICEYLNVFPEELPRLPPEREVEFVINLAPGTQPIFISSYRMGPTELKELKEQLQD